LDECPKVAALYPQFGLHLEQLTPLFLDPKALLLSPAPVFLFNFEPPEPHSLSHSNNVG
jgi:hypothetical protein